MVKAKAKAIHDEIYATDRGLRGTSTASRVWLEKDNFVCLEDKGDCTKLKPFAVFRGAKREVAALNDEFKNKCIVATSIHKCLDE